MVIPCREVLVNCGWSTLLRDAVVTETDVVIGSSKAFVSASVMKDSSVGHWTVMVLTSSLPCCILSHTKEMQMISL